MGTYLAGDGAHAPSFRGTAAEPPELHVRRPNLSLDDLLRFVIKPLHVTLGGLIGCLRRFQGGSCTLYLLLPSAKVGRLVFMLSCPQSLGGLALLLIRAPRFLHGGIHLRLQVTHARRDGTWRGQREGCKERGAKSWDRHRYLLHAGEGALLRRPLAYIFAWQGALALRAGRLLAVSR
jgi:hypothetical protein